MNTPAHVIINLLVLGKGKETKHQLAIAAGALLPDVPMFGFYFFEKIIRKIPEYVIWTHQYHQVSWQNIFDAFHSLPVIGIGLAWSLYARNHLGVLLFSSMLLHVAGDFPLHHDDAHRHFFPLSDWRFESPVSYWDPRYYGEVAASLEILVVIVSCLVLFSRYTSSIQRGLVGMVGVSYMMYFGYVWWVWG